MSDGAEQQKASGIGQAGAQQLRQALEELLNANNVPQRNHISAIEHITGVSYQQTRRRMAGEVSWTVEEIVKIAGHYGAPLFGLLGAWAGQRGLEAPLFVGGVEMGPCLVWLGPRAAGGHTGRFTFLAGKGPRSARVVPTVEVADWGADTMAVHRLHFEEPQAGRIGVLEDDPDLAATWAEFLGHNGYSVAVFASAASFLDGLSDGEFVGFLLDWKVKDGTAAKVLPALRGRFPHVPVVLLTGQLAAGFAKEDELVRVSERFFATLLEKPIRPALLLPQLRGGPRPS